MILKSLWKSGRPLPFHDITKAFQVQKKSVSTLRFYDKKVAQELYEKYGDLIQRINAFLPAEEKLPLAPFQPEGYIDTLDFSIDEGDIKIEASVLG